MEMKPHLRLQLALMVIVAIVGLSLVRRDNTTSIWAASYTGTAAIAGPVELALSVSPPVGSPRDTLELLVRLTNYTTSFISPQVNVNLPATLRVESNQMPTGVTSNISSNSVQWLPVVPPGSGVREIRLPLKVSSADLTHPEQTVTISLETADGKEDASTTLWIGIPPRIERLDTLTQVSVGQELQLKTLMQGPGPFSEVWELGDGRRVAVNEPAVIFPSAGIYDVSVTVKNPVGEANYSSAITVVPHVSAQFEAEDQTPGIGQQISFDNTGGGQQPVQYRWDFGDGTSSAEAQPQHAFTRPGTYNVKLVAENSFGVSETTKIITVGTPPQAEILVADTAPAGAHLAGEAVALDSTGGTEYTWEMGDGRRYNSAKISHAYRQQGDYYVTLTASNDFGETLVGRWVHVEQGIQHVYMPMVSNFGGLAQGSSVDTLPELANTSELDVVVDAPFVMDPIEFSPLTSPIDRLLAYVNEARRQFELPELTISSELSSAAQKHTDDMAETHHNQHTGSDGSRPADRFLEFGYDSGYAGEATAWGFADPRQAVEFWVNSPGHRPIILNRWASEVGLGYTVDYTAPSVWYWSTEFGNASAAADAPELRVQTPQSGLELLNSEEIAFSWNWPLPLGTTEQFTVYLNGPAGPVPVGTVNQPVNGTLYGLTFIPATDRELLGQFEWQVKLENNRGAEITAGERRALTINLDPDLPTPTPMPTFVPTLQPEPSPTATPTATPTRQQPIPRPTEPALPPLVTATPLPLDQ